MISARHILTAVLLSLAVATAASGPPQPPDTKLYEGVLRSHVNTKGQVAYAQLRDNLGPLDTYVRQIGEISPHSHARLFPTREARLAYWINAYNAIVLWAFATGYPEKKGRLGSLIGRGLFFYKRKFRVGGRNLSLAHIENNIVRKEFRDPRIHFALVCASASCPWLATRAYTERNLDEMLEKETRRFLNQDRNVRIDQTGRVVHLSKLFDWYGKDFGENRATRLAFVARYRDGADGLLRGDWKMSYFGYDWSPNDTTTPHGSASPN